MLLPPIELAECVQYTCTIRYTRHLTFVTNSSILDIARVLDPPLYEPYGHLVSTIIFIIFLDSLMFYQIFLSPQVKPWAITTYKHGIYELPHELPNDLRVRILEN